MLREIKNKMFYYVVEKNPHILHEYQQYRWNNEEFHKKNRLKSWMYLGNLNIKHRIIRVPNNLKTGGDIVAKESLPYLEGAESRLSNREPVQHIVKKLLKYDVISFDIFDTLLLRPFAKPSDLFLILGQKLGYLDFQEIRYKEERALRKISFENRGTNEITFADIYERIESYTGIDKNLGMKLEFETELEFCYANPYMKKVFDILKENGKKIIAISDMYLPKNLIEQLLRNCGYEGFEEIFVSCDYGCSKGDLGLYRVADEKIVKGQSVIHIGDNYRADIESSKKFGWDNLYYPNVNHIGQKYRSKDMSPLTGSIYSGIINAHLHNGSKIYSPHYEFGFIYGGLFILGYCTWIYNYAKQNNIDKILFLSRDGYIIKKVYDLMGFDIPSEYVYWSRVANLKTVFEKNKYTFIQEHVWVRGVLMEDIKVSEILENIEAEFLSQHLNDYNLEMDLIIDRDNYQRVEKLILDHWEEFVDSKKDNEEAARLYYEPIIEGCKKVCCVDIGWKGSAAINLKTLIEDVWKKDCRVFGLLAASGKNNSNSNIGMIMDGTLNAYMFSQIDNFEKHEWHRSKKTLNFIVEIFVSAKMPSFSGFKLKEEDYELEFEAPEVENYGVIEEIQEGIIDFAQIYKNTFERYTFLMQIPGGDAYAPIRHITQNDQFVKKFLGEYSFNKWTGSEKKKRKFDSISELIK